jgi:membrane protein
VRDFVQPYLTAFYRHSGMRIMVAAVKRFLLLGHKTHAAALTYTTLFALVPLLTVTYSMLSMIPALQESKGTIQEVLLGNLVPTSADALMGYLYQFSEQARQLTTIGVALLIVTAFMMLRNIEDSFNKVWLLKKGRKGVSSFLLYWAVLSLGPLLLSAGIGVSSYIASLSLWKEDWVPSSGILILAKVLPYVTSFLAFTFIYWAVPNVKVPLKHAAIGGAVVSVFFQIGQQVFTEASTFFPSYQLIYGAFAAVPLFLLWLFLSWSVILLGSEIVFLLGNNDWAEEEKKAKQEKKKQRENNKKLAVEGINSALVSAHEQNFNKPVLTEQDKKLLSLQVLSTMADQQIKGEGLALVDLAELLKPAAKNSALEPLDEQDNLTIEEVKVLEARTDELEALLDFMIDRKLLIRQPNGLYYLIRDLNQYSLKDFLSDAFNF